MNEETEMQHEPTLATMPRSKPALAHPIRILSHLSTAPSKVYILFDDSFVPQPHDNNTPHVPFLFIHPTLRCLETKMPRCSSR